ncbi:unnamed protein product [Clavelina lepadiformis]|uniref:Uncharacterized protein n=1 Tax=Clavelina lepadiformis TaxID=159417 RepID=A0ABP0GAA8_CLALP
MYVCEFLCLKNLFFLMWCGSYVTATNADYNDATPANEPGELSSQTLLETFLAGMIALENRQGYLVLKVVDVKVNRRQ